MWNAIKLKTELKLFVSFLLYMLWFKFFLGLNFFKPVSFLFSFVSDYDNEYKTKRKKMKLV